MNFTNIFQDLRHRAINNVDPRTKDWFLVSSVWYLPALFGLYFLIVKIIVSKFMEKRPPFQCTTYLVVYNILQVIVNAVIFHWFIKYDTFSTNPFICKDVDYSYNEKPYNLAVTLWYTLLVKIIDFSETAMFVLRKKQNQLSYLHVYHHVSTVFFVWSTVRYSPGGVAAVATGINMLVHVIMYTYYLLSVFVPMQRTLIGVKKLLTTMQMVQFVFMATACTQSFFDERCTSTRVLCLMFVPNILYVFNLFRLFYIQTYSKKSKKI